MNTNNLNASPRGGPRKSTAIKGKKQQQIEELTQPAAMRKRTTTLNKKRILGAELFTLDEKDSNSDTSSSYSQNKS